MSLRTFDVRVWGIQKKAKATGARYIVRWSVDGEQHSATFQYKAQADSHRATLLAAAKSGEPFDVGTGLPSGSARGSGPTCYEVAREMVAAKWADSAANSRRSEVDNLAYLLVELIPTNRTAPDGLRLLLRSTLGRGAEELSAAERDQLRWLERASLAITSVDDSVVRRVLDACATSPDGKAYSDTIRRQRRTYLSGLFTFATDRKYVRENPVALVRPGKAARKVKVVQQVNPRQIGDIKTARKVVAAVSDALHRDFAFTVLLAGMRPSEVAALRIQDCHLPVDGWGELTLSKSASVAGSAWTDSGESRDDRGLKHRGKGEVRVVPAPPILVQALRRRVGERTSGYMFERKPGVLVSDSALGRSWQQARESIGVEDDVLPRIYDLRHLAASLWLNAGVPAVEVADRLGHSAEMCLRVYAHVIKTERPRWNAVIEQALA